MTYRIGLNIQQQAGDGMEVNIYYMNAIDNEGTLDGHASITDQDVYVLLSKIPPGKVSTYGDIAKALGHPKAARVIGRIIANNPNPISIPCHRVVKSNGEIGGFAYGEQRKRERLEKEGIKFQNRVGKLRRAKIIVLNKTTSHTELAKK